MYTILHYIVNMGAYSLLGAAVCLLVRAGQHRKNGGAWEWRREALLLLFAAYCTGLASQTILPRWSAGIDSGSGLPFLDISLHNDLASVNLIPFRTILRQLRLLTHPSGDIRTFAVVNLAGNLLVFSPFGILLPLLWPRFRRVGPLLLTGMLISAGIEGIQLFVGRSTDVDDVIFNALGVLIGYGLYRLFAAAREK
ncbi:MAG: VanZ family protein [Oscillospiraceae bacterium]|nr:VanZ family protein [Oscillospiraceae bacterium]